MFVSISSSGSAAAVEAVVALRLLRGSGAAAVATLQKQPVASMERMYQGRGRWPWEGEKGEERRDREGGDGRCRSADVGEYSKQPWRGRRG
jgi:hypothetical protein